MSKLHLFAIYSWLTSLCWKVMDILPPFLRNIVFRLKMEEFSWGGQTPLIDYKTYIRYLPRVSIGPDSSLGRGCQLLASHYYKDVRIKIGAHVRVGPYVSFLAAGHDYSQLDLPDTAGSIHVGDYVWIGAGSIILQGVTIGEGAVIGAGSLVSRDVPAYCIAMGAPVRVIKERVIAPLR